MIILIEMAIWNAPWNRTQPMWEAMDKAYHRRLESVIADPTKMFPYIISPLLGNYIQLLLII